MDNQSRSVKEMWWEDGDLHIIYLDNDEHIVLHNAYYVSETLNSCETDVIQESVIKWDVDGKFVKEIK